MSDIEARMLEELMRTEMRAATGGETRPINPMREEIGFPRAGYAVRMTPEGQESFFRARGVETYRDPSGLLYLYDPGKGEWYPADRPGFTGQDIADVMPDVAQAAPIFAAGTNPLTVAGMAALGSLGRQGVSELLPGSEEMTIPQRAMRVGTEAALAGGSQAVMNKVVPMIWPGMRNAPARLLGRLEDTPYARQGRVLERQLGLTYTPGQRTGFKPLQWTEGAMRRGFATSDIWEDVTERQLAKSLDSLNRTLQRAYGGPKGRAALGGSVARTFDDAMKASLGARSAQGARDFGLVDDLTQGRPVFSGRNMMGTIDELVSEFSIPGGGKEAGAIVRELKRIRDELAPTVFPGLRDVPASLTPSQMQGLLQRWGTAASGRGMPLGQKIDKAQQRYIAGRMFSSLQDDLMDDAAMSGLTGDAAQALRAARANWRENSVAIDRLRNSVLGRMFGTKFDPSDEAVSAKILRMEPSELRAVFDIVDSADRQAVKRLFIEDALERAGVPMSPNVPTIDPRAASQDLWSPRRFLSEMRKSRVWDIMSPEERTEMTLIHRGLERLSRLGEGSPTAPLQEVYDIASGTISGAVSPFLWVLGGRKLSRLMTTPQGQAALVRLGTVNPKSQKWAGTLAYLTELAADVPETAEEVYGPTISRAPR